MISLTNHFKTRIILDHQSRIVQAIIRSEFSLLLAFSRGILIIVKCGGLQKKAKEQMKSQANFFFPSCYQEPGKRQKNRSVVERKKKVVKTKKAVYFMITTLTYANNFYIMKGMMNIKHIKIK